jgi:AAA+ ATPase superfamily predicted ATPase
MTNEKIIIGRKKEKAKLNSIINSKKSEFLALYGRRRVGKTFLIKEHFNYKFDFYMAGLATAETSQQLFNFDEELKKQSNLIYDSPSGNWLVAFQKLKDHLENIAGQRKIVIFIDELPWFDTHGSDFMMGLEHFWNTWATNRKDIVLIVCGSAASWMLNELINNTGGLHNRVTQKMKIEPFNLKETEEMLIAKNCAFDRYQIIQLYMALGGIPYYLEAVEPHLSVPQNIQALFFEKSGLLKNEFFNLYRSLYKKHEVYEKVVAALSSKTIGLQRSEIIKQSGMASGGTLTKILSDLEESGFISSYRSFDNKLKEITYRLSDYYTAFYFRFLQNKTHVDENAWLNLMDSPQVVAWQGFTFEQLCLDHIWQIKKALGISGIQSNNASWRGKTEEKAAQIDLLIDRRDQVINLCECKFSIDTFSIDKEYSEKLRSKISVFKTASKSKKAVFLTFITSYGLEKNKYANSLVQNEIMMDDLFESSSTIL